MIKKKGKAVETIDFVIKIPRKTIEDHINYLVRSLSEQLDATPEDLRKAGLTEAQISATLMDYYLNNLGTDIWEYMDDAYTGIDCLDHPDCYTKMGNKLIKIVFRREQKEKMLNQGQEIAKAQTFLRSKGYTVTKL